MDVSRGFGRQLREARKGRDLGIKALAQQVGVDYSYISRVERGLTKPSEEFVRKIARVLRLKVEPLLSSAGHFPSDVRKILTQHPEDAIHFLREHFPPYGRRDGQPHQPEAADNPPTTQFADPVSLLFPAHYALVPQLNEVYELKLAFMETRVLSEDDIVQRAAYFMRVGDRFTNHFLMCSGSPLKIAKATSMRLKTFFEANIFKTGYATHGLFPYRGKFHPQMIKALLNVMELKPGETVLDPMMGSGTALIEAATMGINAIGFDPSPFCQLMARSKAAGLTIDVDELRALLRTTDAVAKHFHGRFSDGTRPRSPSEQGLLFEPAKRQRVHVGRLDCSPAVADFVQLAYLDSVGFAERRVKKSPAELFEEVFSKYVGAVEKFQGAMGSRLGSLGNVRAEVGDARALPLADASVDGVIFSPPYSFAIDYLENDAAQLTRLGCNLEDLREGMIGLRGKPGPEQVDAYFEDMGTVMREIGRVLKPSRYCTIIVGSNTKQLARILGKPEGEVQGIEDRLTDLGAAGGLSPVTRIQRQITGMANALRAEYILIFRREPH